MGGACLAIHQCNATIGFEGLSTYTMVPSTRSPGYLNITVRWNAVPDVLMYQVWDETNALLASTTGTGYLAQEVPTHRTLTVCVGAVYPYNVTQHKTAPCIQSTT